MKFSLIWLTTCLALLLNALPGLTQSTTLTVNGEIYSTNSLPVSVTLSTDSFATSTVVTTNTLGEFTATLSTNLSQGVIYLQFTDCDSVVHNDIAYFNPSLTTIIYSADWCPSPAANTIVLNVNIQNAAGATALYVLTDTMLVADTLYTDANGNLSEVIAVNNLINPVVVSFLDCTGQLQTATLYVTSGTNQIYYSPSYCCGNPPTLTSASTNATCAGSDGTIDVTVSGGTAPYNYIWNTGAFLPNIGNLAAGTYCLTVSDQLGCTVDTCITISQLSGMQVALSSIDDSTGTWIVTTTVSGGSAPYAFNWDNGANSSTLTNVPAGNYCVTVTDANGCTAESCVTAGNSSTTIIVYGMLINADNLGVPVTIIADGIATNINTLPNGSFTSTVFLANIFSGVVISYTNCLGTLINDIAFITPGTVIINYTSNYCPSGGTIVVNGQLSNTNGTIATVSITTDLNTTGVDVNTDPNGNFTYTTSVNDISNPIGIDFTDCNGLLQVNQVYVDPNTNTASFTADYCQTIPPPCDTMFTATYCTCDTAFTLEMDSATQASGASYVWDFGDGTIDSTNLFPVHTYAASGLYNVCLFTMTPGNFCSYCHEIGIDSAGNIVTRMDLAGFIIKVVPFGTTGLKEVTPNQSFDIYPNPIDENGTVSLYSDKETMYTINIINPIGQRIRTINVNAQAGLNTFHLPVQDLAKGFYMMTIDFESKQINGSFVK